MFSDKVSIYMTHPAYKPTKELEEKALDWGRTGGGWVAFADEMDIDEQTASKHYNKFWRKGKNEIARQSGAMYINMIQQNYNDIKKLEGAGEKIDKRNNLCKVLDKFLEKRGGAEWLAKQQIEQTNVNIEAPVTNLDKLTEEDKDKMKELILKAKG